MAEIVQARKSTGCLHCGRAINVAELYCRTGRWRYCLRCERSLERRGRFHIKEKFERQKGV
jgi:uncharacterized paraquat-inducible protein A